MPKQIVYELPQNPTVTGYFKYRLPSLGKPRRASVVPTSFGKRIVSPAYFCK